MSDKEERVFASEDEVLDYYKQDKENNKVVIFEGVVYDVKEYMPEHPGGPEYLEDNLGTSIDQEFEEAEHTKFARKIFNDLPKRGKLDMKSVKESQASKSSESTSASTKSNSSNDPVIDQDYIQEKQSTPMKSDSFDYTKGIAWQVWQHEWTFEEYTRFINEPKHFVNPVRDLKMFDTAWMEPLSKCPWWVIVVFWLPYIYTFVPLLSDRVFRDIGLIVLGINGFFLVEYVLHRFLFHGEHYWMKYVPKTRLFYYAHFMLHGLHHAFPQDKHRLVLPPILGWFYFSVMFRIPFLYLLPEDIQPAFCIGFGIGYLMYDLTHYFIHHSNPADGSYFKMMRVYHMQHHYKHGEEGFGISNKIWDKIFNTEINMDTKDKKE